VDWGGQARRLRFEHQLASVNVEGRKRVSFVTAKTRSTYGTTIDEAIPPAANGPYSNLRRLRRDEQAD
jgi:hypothetical protein